MTMGRDLGNAMVCASLLALMLAQCVWADEPKYKAEVHIYHVHDTPIHFYGWNGVDANVNSELEGTLDLPITIQFDEVHLSDIFKFIGAIYGIPFQIDDGLVAPKGQDVGTYFSAGKIGYVNLKEVPVRRALDTLLAPLGLDYAVTAENIRILKASGKSPSDSAQQQMVTGYQPTEHWEVLKTGSMRVGRSMVHFAKGERASIGNVDGVANLANPTLVLPANRPGAVDINGTVQYLVPGVEKEGSYLVRNTEAFAGLKVGLQFSPGAENTVDCEFDLDYNYIRERLKVKDVLLDVGMPVIEKIATKEKIQVPLDQPVAMLTRTGEQKDVILVLLRVLQIPETQPISDQPQPPTYTVGMKMFHIHGKPNWSFWTQDYALEYAYRDGAGRMFGPVALRETFNVDRFGEQLGFSGIAQKEITPLCSPRGAGQLDRRLAIERDPNSSLSKIILNVMGPLPDSITPNTDSAKNALPVAKVPKLLVAIYNSLALRPATLDFEELKAKITIVAANIEPDEAGNLTLAAPGNGSLAMLEGRSGNTPDIYRLDQTILLRQALAVKRGDPLIARMQFNCDYEIKNGSGVAFLLPVADEEYVVIVSEFDLIKDVR